MSSGWDTFTDVAQLGANFTTIAGGLGKPLLCLGKITGSLTPFGALVEADAKQKKTEKLLYDMKDIMDVHTHDKLQSDFEELFVTRERMNLSWRQDPKQLKMLFNAMYAFRKLAVQLYKETKRSSQLARKAHMRDVKETRKRNTNGSGPPDAGRTPNGTSRETRHELPSDSNAGRPADQSNIPRTPLEATNVPIQLHVYLATPDENPFRDRPAIVLSEVDLQASVAEDQLNMALMPRNLDAEETIILQSMSFSEAFPGGVIH